MSYKKDIVPKMNCYRLQIVFETKEYFVFLSLYNNVENKFTAIALIF